MRLRFLALIFAILAPVTLHASWPSGAMQRIARKSADLAPPDVRLLIEKYPSDYAEGYLADEGEEARHTFIVQTRKGALRSMIHDEVKGAVKMVRAREPMRDFVRKLGRIAHLTADANNPFHVANSDPRLVESQVDFERYFERKVSKFPTVFYGLASPFKLEPYMDAALIRSSSYYPLLSEEYFRFGERRTSAEFDDRSTAFGVAALSYSHSVSDIVNLYYYIWKEAGGDVRAAAAMKQGNLLLNPNGN